MFLLNQFEENIKKCGDFFFFYFFSFNHKPNEVRELSVIKGFFPTIFIDCTCLLHKHCLKTIKQTKERHLIHRKDAGNDKEIISLLFG